MHFPYYFKMFLILIYAFDFFAGVNGIIVTVTAFGFSKLRSLRRIFFSFLVRKQIYCRILQSHFSMLKMIYSQSKLYI